MNVNKLENKASHKKFSWLSWYFINNNQQIKHYAILHSIYPSSFY